MPTWNLCLWRWSDYYVNNFIIGMYMDNYIHVYKGKVLEIESNPVSYEVNQYDLERERAAEESSVWFLEQDITKTSVGMINGDNQGFEWSSQWNSASATSWNRWDKSSSDMIIRRFILSTALEM